MAKKRLRICGVENLIFFLLGHFWYFFSIFFNSFFFLIFPWKLIRHSYFTPYSYTWLLQVYLESLSDHWPLFNSILFTILTFIFFLIIFQMGLFRIKTSRTSYNWLPGHNSTDRAGIFQYKVSKLINILSWRKRGSASNPKMEYQVLSCIFH